MGYADDLSLMCPSFSGIKKMLNICERFANGNTIFIMLVFFPMPLKIFSLLTPQYIIITHAININCGQLVVYTSMYIARFALLA